MPTEGLLFPMLVLGFLALIALVERLALRLGWSWYFQIGMPLGRVLVPLERPPEGEGEVDGLRWRVVDEGRSVQFWGEGGHTPRGLHGLVLLQLDQRRRVHLDLRWAPTWLQPAVCLALALVGFARGEHLVSGWLASLLMGALLYGSWIAAVDASRKLRWSLGKHSAERSAETPR